MTTAFYALLAFTALVVAWVAWGTYRSRRIREQRRADLAARAAMHRWDAVPRRDSYRGVTR